MAEPEVIVSRVGRAASVVLNRPRALNAINLPAVRALSRFVDDVFASSGVAVAAAAAGGARGSGAAPAVLPPPSCFIMKGAGGKAFCAGGDIKTIWEQGRQNQKAPGTHDQLAFFREEYVLDLGLAALNGVCVSVGAGKGRGAGPGAAAPAPAPGFPAPGFPAAAAAAAAPGPATAASAASPGPLHRSPRPLCPQVALWDGPVMGGGVGLSISALYRVATERSVWAMPETAIGFVPDVGASWWLNRTLRAEAGGAALGRYLALTGARLAGADLVHAGVATHYVPSASLPALEAALAGAETAEQVGAAVNAASAAVQGGLPAPSKLTARDVADIESLFGPGTGSGSGSSAPASTVAAVLASCRARAGESAVAAAAAASLPRLSPLALLLTDEQLRRGARLPSMADCFRMELRLASRLLRGADFYEGVRAVLVDKDGKPKWAPATLEEAQARPGLVEEAFAPMASPAEELHIPAHLLD